LAIDDSELAPFLNPRTEAWEVYYSRHFKRELTEISRFWERFPETFDFENKKVLDFGSGIGCMPIVLAGRNAGHVTGLEIDPGFTEFSNYNLDKTYPEFKDRVSYLCKNLEKIEDNAFDIIISKDVFEHVIGLREIIPKLVTKLKPGGRMILGWGPLWYSPFGDHGLSKKAMGITLPWLHLFLKEKKLLETVNQERLKQGQKAVKSIHEFGMNMEPYQGYRELICSLGLKIEYFETNRTNRFPLINKIPVPRRLEKYWIRTIYCILSKEI